MKPKFALSRSPSLSDADFGSNIYGRVSAFLAECNPEQVRFCPELFAEMSRALSDELVRKAIKSFNARGGKRRNNFFCHIVILN